MNPREIESELTDLLRDRYPDLKVRVEPSGKGRSEATVNFVASNFSALYPSQRHHSLVHLIPAEFVEENLSNFAWYELAPGETPEDLIYPDGKLISSIAPDVMRCLLDADFFGALDEALYPSDKARAPQPCHGDFRNSKSVLIAKGFQEAEFFDVFHVLMARGGYCDCEILYNAAESSRLKQDYWRARSVSREPYNPHGSVG